MPTISVYDHQLAQAVDLAWLADRAEAGLPQCLAVAKTPAALAELHEVEVSIVSDAEIARIHAEFMDDPTPTDVITFHHGEILISADTAARAAPAQGLSLDQELLLYLIHGLLHLGGWDDHEPAEQAEMHRHQAAILASLVAGP